MEELCGLKKGGREGEIVYDSDSDRTSCKNICHAKKSSNSKRMFFFLSFCGGN